MSAAPPEHGFYACVVCRGSVQRSPSGTLTCTVCARAYPPVGGIQLFVTDPTRALGLRLRALAEERRGLTASKARLTDAALAGRSREARSLAERGLDGQFANLELVERTMAPASEFLSTHPRRPSRFAEISPGDDGSWTSLKMLPYFFRDWSGTREFSLLAGLFGAAVDEYCVNRRQSVAVLGCGACGLVYEMAEFFPTVFGLDSAVDAMLLAKSLLDGGAIDLNFNFPLESVPISQVAVTLQGPAVKRGGIDLIAANALRLPFSSGALSCVITHYLLDVAPGPKTLVAEVHRVLVPGGIWIDFSTQFSSPSVGSNDTLDLLDPPSFLQRSGFTSLHRAVQRHVHIDLTSLSEWAMAVTHTPVLSVARRDASPDQAVDHFADYFAGKADTLLAMVPVFSSHVGLVEETIRDIHGSEQRKLIFSSENRRLTTNEGAAAAEWLLGHIDGQRTTGEIVEALRSEHGDVEVAAEFLELLREFKECELIAFTGG
jgi:SAM-dependent methyltransferase